MNPGDELFLLRWNRIKLPPSVLQLPAGVEARDILWLMSASSYAALVTTPRPRTHQSHTTPHFTPPAQIQLVPHVDETAGEKKEKKKKQPT